MRLVKLAVQNFQALASAEVEFGPGLNVLFGPNDLGKSTLATAIRAALLVVPGTTTAKPFLPWHSGSSPQVTLTLTDDQNHYWRIRKTFGESSGEAELFHSKDGISFALDCKSRQVEERTRSLLGWGIPAPGGKGAPRGMPVSFLAKALLAEQTEVDDILSASVAQDSDESGKLRLSKALAALAQDPRFKRVLALAQQEVDQYFTASGKPKRGQGSEFTRRAEDVKRHARQFAELQKQVEESNTAELAIARLSEQRLAAEVQLDAATTALEASRTRQRRAGERDAVAERLVHAQRAMADIDARAAAVATRARGLEQLLAALQDDEERASEQKRAVEEAEATLRAVEDNLRSARSADGERERELRRAQLLQSVAELRERGSELEQRKQRTEAAAAALASLSNTASALKAAEQAEKRASEAAALSTTRAEKAEAELELGRATVAYARWLASTEAAAQCTQAIAAGQHTRAEAEAKQRSALEHDATSNVIDGDASREQARLPAADQLEALGRLEHNLALAQAALGGGMSIVLRGTGKFDVRARLDTAEVASQGRLDGRHVLQADGSATLSIEDALEIEIIAGAPEKRRELETLRERWQHEAVAVLRKAGVASLSELRSRADALQAARAQAEHHRRGASQLRAEAETLIARAGTHDARVDELQRRSARMGEWEAALSTHDRAKLARRLRKLEAPLEQTAERQQASREETARDARKHAETSARELHQTTYARTQLRTNHEALAAQAERLCAALPLDPGADIAAVVRECAQALAALQAQRGELDRQLQAVDADAANTIELAERAVERARQKFAAHQTAHGLTLDAITSKRSDLDIRRGELNALRAELDKLDARAARGAVQQCASELAAFAGDPPFAPSEVLEAEQAVIAARRALEQATRELDQARGALSHIGGNAAAEDLSRMDEAVQRAKQREREFEIEADSWKLLRETLRDVENEEGTHLGRALATPVAARFVELTRARYEGLQLDAHLTAQSVLLPGGAGQALSALSVGTREQLATLLRLTIAEQLRSTVVLDDHLVQTDPGRLDWFKQALRRTAVTTQVIVFTCRPRDYVTDAELPQGPSVRDLAGGLLRAIDLAPLLQR